MGHEEGPDWGLLQDLLGRVRPCLHAALDVVHQAGPDVQAGPEASDALLLEGEGEDESEELQEVKLVVLLTAAHPTDVKGNKEPEKVCNLLQIDLVQLGFVLF